MALRRDEMWDIYFMSSYLFMFGEFEEEYTDPNERIFFIFKSIILPLVMVNLIITIIAEEFGKAQDRIAVADIKESLSLIREVSKFVTCFSGNYQLRYFHWISTELLREKKDDSDVYEGRLKYITR